MKKNKVERLMLTERAALEKTALDTLQTSLGQGQSREVVERAACEVSDRLNSLEAALSNGDLAAAGRLANSLIAISRQIGLISFAQVAGDLAGAIDNNDYVAIASISRRLIRQADATLFQALDYVTEHLSEP
ncbi:hypothetical protein [Neptunicoccus sediminis]|uniref:hypothetical protein n=1 Tax=Neptunicoccus sediminis TaxID=1892596 RepID=UPI0009F2DCCE|nr:hypothetical protein [Neptunicoccus sediminis]